jgi:hypothetical protein
VALKRLFNTSLPQPHGFFLLDNTLLLCPFMSFPSHSPPTARPPNTFTLKTATATFAETSGKLQHLTQLFPKSQSCNIRLFKQTTKLFKFYKSYLSYNG